MPSNRVSDCRASGATRDENKPDSPNVKHQRGHGEKKVEHQYWLVGATYGSEDQYDRFVNGGFWMLGWEEEDQPSQYSAAKRMKKGDRIAIKKKNGYAAKDITIRSIGVIREVVVDNARIFCTVDWCAKDINHSVPSRGCFSSIHGPYSIQEDGDWICKIFVL